MKHRNVPVSFLRIFLLSSNLHITRKSTYLALIHINIKQNYCSYIIQHNMYYIEDCYEIMVTLKVDKL